LGKRGTADAEWLVSSALSDERDRSGPFLGGGSIVLHGFLAEMETSIPKNEDHLPPAFCVLDDALVVRSCSSPPFSLNLDNLLRFIFGVPWLMVVKRLHLVPPLRGPGRIFILCGECCSGRVNFFLVSANSNFRCESPILLAFISQSFFAFFLTQVRDRRKPAAFFFYSLFLEFTALIAL